MKDDPSDFMTGFLVGTVVWLIIVAAISVIPDSNLRKLRADLVKQGYAEWVTDEYGWTTFKLKPVEPFDK